MVNGTRDASTMSAWADKYRGAVVEDLDPPPALSVSPITPISNALLSAFERDYTHLTVVDPENRSLLGYLSIPKLKGLLKDGVVVDSDPVHKAMNRFRRRGRRYKVITMETPLEELEAFFEGKGFGDDADGGSEMRPAGEKQDFAVVTDAGRRFVLGVATRADLEEFVKRRP
ncbi:putative cystathionine beta-synthase [Rhizodiscina lignyota]|uniref:Cystathionine beta-synthase n=1 Tax=Rhizodiscina lignyota TaxID=1504668 RepID=A0A9P4I7U0_9PEZI|nr:putative cystathionine beta-synthase [Rhizodiscina lignyota]